MLIRKPKIVVIDDSEIVLEVTKGALEGAGYEVVTHDRPAGCVALILHEKPDLVLMDVNMPGLGGDTIVSVLGKAAPTSDTIVLLHSSLSGEVLRGKVTSAGAHGFIQKSGDLFGLVREVGRWLKRVHSSANMRAATVVVADDRQSGGTRVSAPVSSSFGPMSGTMPIAGTVSNAPASSAGPPSSDARGAAARRTSGTVRLDVPTVLLVDDDMGVLSGYRRSLQVEELSVEFALSGAQALRRLLSDNPPDVVVCDMLLPDVSGVEVYQRAVAAEPSYRQRFTVATGASGTPVVAAFLATFTGPVLHKPVAGGQLIGAVRLCLNGARPFLKSGART